MRARGLARRRAARRFAQPGANGACFLGAARREAAAAAIGRRRPYARPAQRLNRNASSNSVFILTISARSCCALKSRPKIAASVKRFDTM